MRKNVFRRATAALLSAAAIALAAPAVTATAAAPATTGTILPSGQKLMPGQSMVSGESSLVMQWDGNLVLYLDGPTGNHGPAVWSSGTYGNWGAYAYMQPDGNFVVYRQNGSGHADALWSTWSWGHAGATATLVNGWLVVSGSGAYWQTGTGAAPTVQNGGFHPETIINDSRGVSAGTWLVSNSVWLINQADGNLVLYRKRDGAALWSSGTSGHPGSILFVSNTTGNLYLSSSHTGQTFWSVPVSGHPGAYGKLQDDGNFVLYSSSGTPLWNTGTWGNW